MNNWEKVKLLEVVDFISEKISIDKITKKNYISTENLLADKQGVLIASNLPKISKVNHFKIGDILFSNIRTYFKKVWFADFEGGSSNDVLIFRPKNENKVYKKFLYYLISSDFFIDFTVLTAKGTKMPRGDKGAIKTFSFFLPPLPEQKAIAGVLGSLDDKIELLQEQNETLEKTAQTIFKEWFVDFNFPDKDGKPYKDNQGKMINSEQGKIPEGWRVESLSNIAEFLNGLALQKYPPKDDNYLPVIKIREMKNGITDQTGKASLDIDEKYIIKNGDVLFSWSGSLEVVIWKYGKGALNQHLFKVTSKIFPKWFYYYWILKYLPEFRQIASSKAVTMGHIKRHHLDDAKVIIPSKQVLEKSDNFFNRILNKIELNNNQIQTLTKTRDILLPKLMSGEVRVK